MTVTAERTVLAVARTVTSTLRVMDAVKSLSGDHRVQVVFAINDSSPFSSGVRQLLEDVEAPVVPWSEAGRLSFDLVVTASENTELASFDAPVLLLPHGVGFQKVLPDSRGVGSRLSGSPRREDVQGRRVTVGVSHPDQAVELVAHAPYLAGMTAVIADPVHERLVASSLFRDRYRAALGVGDRRLVVLSSTWGAESLMGRWPDLPARLLAELPADEYQVAAVLHPNIWSGHGAWQVRSWLAHAQAAGLMVMPPEGSWPAMLVAADCVIADHGSVSLYAAAADRPLLLAPLGDETVPGTAISMLASRTVRLNASGSLREQVVRAVAGHRSGGHAEVVAKAFAAAPAARSTRGIVYELLGLPVPPHDPPLAGYPVPAPDSAVPGSYAIYTRQFAGGVEVRRIPAAVDSAGTAPDDWWRHLAVNEREWDLRMLESAAVLVCLAGDENKMLARLPGARIAVAPTANGVIATVRGGARVHVHDHARRWDPMLLGALVWTGLHADVDFAGTIALRVGDTISPVHLRRGN